MKPRNVALSSTFPSAMSGVFSHQVDRKPHHSRYWLNRTPEEAADAKMTDVTTLYLQAPT